MIQRAIVQDWKTSIGKHVRYFDIENRWFFMKYRNFSSKDHSIKVGVPQGRILGPLLCLIYISDLPVNNNLLISTFVDDMAILSSCGNPKPVASESLELHLKKLEQWLKIWGIRADGRKSWHVTVTLNWKTCSPIPRYLGFHFDWRFIFWGHS